MCLHCPRRSNGWLDAYLPLELQRFQGHHVGLEERRQSGLPFAGSSCHSLNWEWNPLAQNEWCWNMSAAAEPQEWCFLRRQTDKSLLKCYCFERYFHLVTLNCLDWKRKAFLHHLHCTPRGGQWGLWMAKVRSGVASPQHSWGSISQRGAAVLCLGRKNY